MPSVVMTCPACGEAVRLSREEDEAVSCKACGARVPVPDEVRAAISSPESARILPDTTGRLSPSPGRSKSEPPKPAARPPSRLNRLLVLPLGVALLGSALLAALFFQAGVDPTLGLASRLICAPVCDDCRGPVLRFTTGKGDDALELLRCSRDSLPAPDPKDVQAFARYPDPGARTALIFPATAVPLFLLFLALGWWSLRRTAGADPA